MGGCALFAPGMGTFGTDERRRRVRAPRNSLATGGPPRPAAPLRINYVTRTNYDVAPAAAVRSRARGRGARRRHVLEEAGNGGLVEKKVEETGDGVVVADKEGGDGGVAKEEEEVGDGGVLGKEEEADDDGRVPEQDADGERVSRKEQEGGGDRVGVAEEMDAPPTPRVHH